MGQVQHLNKTIEELDKKSPISNVRHRTHSEGFSKDNTLV